MGKLDSSKRARLPDSAFAYIDARGRRRLPINDEAHVRNALARFDRVEFEDEAARERARRRLLNAAKRFGIVPVGFVAFVGLRLALPADTQARKIESDWTGFLALAVAMSAVQLVLARGVRLDWFESTEIIIECIIAAIAF